MTEKIGYNPYFYNYPQYLSNNLGVNNKFSPNFRGEGVGVATSQPTVNYTTPPDTVEISAGNKINEASTQEKQKAGMSTGAKIGLGILGTAATLGIGIITHKNYQCKIAENNLSKIFRRDLSNQEAKKILKNYQEIFKENDCNEFCNKLFAEIKNNYGYKDCDIPLQITKITEENLKDVAGGGWVSTKGVMRLRPYLSNSKTLTIKEKDQIFSTLMHEFQHVKQDEIAYRTSKTKFLEALEYAQKLPTGEELQKELKKIKEILNDDKKLKSMAIQRNQSIESLKSDLKKSLNGDHSAFEFNYAKTEKALDKIFGKFEKLESNRDEYKKGLKYIENTRNYIDCNNDEEGYLKQILEQEAYGIEKELLPAIKKYLSII